jgi:hypothetical protein
MEIITLEFCANYWENKSGCHTWDHPSSLLQRPQRSSRPLHQFDPQGSWPSRAIPLLTSPGFEEYHWDTTFPIALESLLCSRRLPMISGLSRIRLTFAMCRDRQMPFSFWVVGFCPCHCVSLTYPSSWVSNPQFLLIRHHHCPPPPIPCSQLVVYCATLPKILFSAGAFSNLPSSSAS